MTSFLSEAIAIDKQAVNAVNVKILYDLSYCKYLCFILTTSAISLGGLITIISLYNTIVIAIYSTSIIFGNICICGIGYLYLKDRIEQEQIVLEEVVEVI